MEQQVCENQFIVNEKFYEHAAEYWEKIPATVDGMLGGFGYISKIDIIGSKTFLKSVFQLSDSLSKQTHALDCGAGIGRITGNLLTKYFKTVDLVEQNPKFLEQAKIYLKDCLHRVGEFYSVGLQDFCPEPGKYDLIWCQWVLGHLNHEDLIKFFKNCRKGLKSNGLMIVKENITSSTKIEIDKEDSSVTRPRSHLLEAFKNAGFECVKESKQSYMPDGLYPVHMFALKPNIQIEN